jgi:hypothetical protein
LGVTDWGLGVWTEIHLKKSINGFKNQRMRRVREYYSLCKE